MKMWDINANRAFQDLKHALITAPILVAPRWSEPFFVYTDASHLAVGATLTQKDADGRDRVIAYMSRKLNSAEQNYTANDRELLGVILHYNDSDATLRVVRSTS